MKKKNNNWNSSEITQGVSRAPNRAMLRAVGFQDQDFKKPIVAIASGQSNITPCNLGLNALREKIEAGVKESGGMAQNFGTITISDGISMGTEGMKYSLISREVIADSIETVCRGQSMDALITIGGCDKNMPGALMAIARLDIPAIFVYGGTIPAGKYQGKDLNIVSVFEAVGSYSSGALSQTDFYEIEKRACPQAGSCGGMYTANTMSSAFEALGMSLPESSTMTSLSPEILKKAGENGEQIMQILKQDIRPSNILTPAAFENAIVVVMALGGSTNAVLHLLAIAHSAKIQLDIDRFEEIARKTPHIADLKPSGKFLTTDLHEVGGVLHIMSILDSAALLNGDCLTITGQTTAENIRKWRSKKEESARKTNVIKKVISSLDSPIYTRGHIVILKGNLSPTGAVAKISGVKSPVFTGPAQIFDSEEDAMKAIISENKIKKGSVIVIRYEGPKGGPGMREMLAPTSAIIGKGLAEHVALITDGRFSGGTYGMVVGHISPEAAIGGPIGLLQDGDQIYIDATKNLIQVKLSDEELQQRKLEKKWKKKVQQRYSSGVIAKYRLLVNGAENGAVTDGRQMRALMSD